MENLDIEVEAHTLKNESRTYDYHLKKYDFLFVMHVCDSGIEYSEMYTRCKYLTLDWIHEDGTRDTIAGSNRSFIKVKIFYQQNKTKKIFNNSSNL